VELYENTYRGLLAQQPAGQLLDTADSAVRKGPLGDFSQRVLIITAHQQRKGHSESYGAPYLLQQLMAAKVVPHGKQSAYINIKALKQLQLPDGSKPFGQVAATAGRWMLHKVSRVNHMMREDLEKNKQQQQQQQQQMPPPRQTRGRSAQQAATAAQAPSYFTKDVDQVCSHVKAVPQQCCCTLGWTDCAERKVAHHSAWK
jgi:hypothetical protein